MRIVPSACSPLRPMARSDALTFCLCDAHAEPVETRIPAPSSALRITSPRTPSNDTLRICGALASLMTGMVRSLGIPCKLVVGYAGSAYHAWISIWTEESGWVDNVIFFNGTSWQRMDPTFASSGKQSASIMAYIGDSKNYTTKYLY